LIDYPEQAAARVGSDTLKHLQPVPAATKMDVRRIKK
jgi:hypothetical protein